MVRFRFLVGDVNFIVYGGKWVSNRQNNGEFDYWFVIELMNWVESVGERDAPKEKYNVSVSVVSPQQAGEENMRQAYESSGIGDEMLATATENGYLAEVQVEALHGYAGGVPVWDANGNNWRKLMKEARRQAQAATTLFGFYMDRPVNRLGETGWEHLKLTDPREVIQRRLAEEKPDPAVKIMAKMHGIQ